MNIIRDEAELAKILAENPGVYLQLKSGLSALDGKNILVGEVENGLQQTLGAIERANRTARNSDYFVFQVYDSWAQEQFRSGEGYAVFQKCCDEIILKLGINQKPPSFRKIVSFLKRNQINRIFSAQIPETGYFGLMPKNVDPGDSQVITYKKLDKKEIKRFRKQGIELFVL